MESKWYCIYPAGKQLSIVAKIFLDYLQNAVQTLLEMYAYHKITKYWPIPY